MFVDCSKEVQLISGSPILPLCRLSLIVVSFKSKKKLGPQDFYVRRKAPNNLIELRSHSFDEL